MDIGMGYQDSQKAFEGFNEIDFTTLTRYVSEKLKNQKYVVYRTDLERIMEALNGFQTANDEYRFQTSLAHFYTGSLTEEMKNLRSEQTPLPLSETVKMLLFPLRQSIMPIDLLERADAVIGNRLVGNWFAGQLINSSINLLVSASDKLFSTICFIEGFQIDKDGYPKFTERHLKELSSTRKSKLDISKLKEIEKSNVNKTVRKIRNINLHGKNLATDHNGEFVTQSEIQYQHEPTVSIKDLQLLPSLFHNLVVFEMYSVLTKQVKNLYQEEPLAP